MFHESQPSTMDAALEGEPGHSSKVDRAARGGHAEAVVAVSAKGALARGGMVAVDGRVLGFDAHFWKGVEEPALAALNSAGP